MYKLHRLTLLALLALALPASSACAGGSELVDPTPAPTPLGSIVAHVQTGKLRHWPEATKHMVVAIDEGTQAASAKLGAAEPSAPGAFWSIASTKGAGSGFFYSELSQESSPKESATRVAFASSARRVQDIHDASAFDYSKRSVGPVPVGGIVIVHHLPSRRYLAIVVDAIEAVDPRSAGAGPYAYADVTWYLTPEDGVDFSGAP